MGDIERWINLEGPTPPRVKELLDAAVDVPERTPEQAAEDQRVILAALAEQDRQLDLEERNKRRVKRWAVGGGLAAAAAVAIAAAVGGGAMVARVFSGPDPEKGGRRAGAPVMEGLDAGASAQPDPSPPRRRQLP